MANNIADVPQTTFRNRQILAVLSPLSAAFTLGLLTDPYFDNSFGSYFPLWPIYVVSVLGSLVSGIGMECIGRKKMTIFCCYMSAIGWATMGFAHILIGYVICFLSAGMIFPVIPVYISELSEPRYRSVFLSAIQLGFTLGNVATTVLDMLMVEEAAIYVCAILISIIGLIPVMSRESPIWLMNKGKSKEAMDQWMHLRGSKSLEEYHAMEHAPLRNSVCSKQFLCPLMILCALFFISRFGSFNAVYLLIELFTVSVKPAIILIKIFAIIVANIIACVIVSMFERRPLILISGVGTSFNLFLICFVHYFQDSATWLFIWIGMYVILFSAGLHILPVIICGELFPRKLRSYGAGIACSFYFTFLCVYKAVFPNMLLIPYLFACCGFLALFGMIFLWLKTPETKNKTLLEIEQAFDKEPEENDGAVVEMIKHDGKP